MKTKPKKKIKRRVYTGWIDPTDLGQLPIVTEPGDYAVYFGTVVACPEDRKCRIVVEWEEK